MTTSANKQPRRVFLSYASEDAALGKRLMKLLSRRPNVRIFTDKMLSAGEGWQDKLKEELLGSDVFIVVLSPDATESSFVLQELGAAWAAGKRIVPVVTSPGVLSKIPAYVSLAQEIEVTELDKPETIERILQQHETEIVAG